MSSRKHLRKEFEHVTNLLATLCASLQEQGLLSNDYQHSAGNTTPSKFYWDLKEWWEEYKRNNRSKS